MKSFNKKYTPNISVVMPVYNSGEFLLSSVKSVLNQTFTNFELVIVDDGSTDGSYELLKSLAKTDSRIRLYKNKVNRGIGYTRRRLMRLAKADFIAIMDSDDIMVSDRLERQFTYLRKHPHVVVVGGQCILINEKNEFVGQKLFPTAHKDIYEMMFTRMSMQQPATMINRTLVPEGFNWYDNSISPVEDLDNLFQLFQYGKFANLKKPVLYYRIYKESSSLRNPKRTYLLTKLARKRAIFLYGYKPTAKAVIVSKIQDVVVFFMPAKLIFPVYSMVRGMKQFSLQLELGRMKVKDVAVATA